jgi:hypothetical protein
MKIFYTKLFCLLFLCVVTPSFANAYLFTRDLKLGDSNIDVVELQKILNLDSATKVSLSGLGSTGNETNYFGYLTKQAVIRFQERYKKEILLPNGLSFGTGFVGVSTRKKLGNLNATANIVNKPVLSDVIAPISNNNTYNSINLTNIASNVVSAEFLFKPFSEKDVLLTSISAFEVKSGDILDIKATGLMSENILHIGDIYSTNLNSINGNIKISVPNIINGVYAVWISNKNGTSKEKSSQYIKISNQSKVSPVITKSYPEKVSESGFITLEGTGFDDQNNTIYSTLGTLSGVSSKNGKITFSIADFSEIKKNNGKDLGLGAVVTYGVKSSNGYSKNFGMFSPYSTIAKKNINIFDSILSFVDKTISSIYGKKALASSSRMFDGGTIGGVDKECTCSGSQIIKFSSYVDSQDYKYIYQPGMTMLYENRNITSQGNYFLDTHISYGVCMVIKGEYCEEEGNPDGTLMTAGTS